MEWSDNEEFDTLVEEDIKLIKVNKSEQQKKVAHGKSHYETLLNLKHKHEVFVNNTLHIHEVKCSKRKTH